MAAPCAQEPEAVFEKQSATEEKASGTFGFSETFVSQHEILSYFIS